MSICPHCKQPMPESDMLDDIFDALFDKGVQLKPSQARRIRREVMDGIIERAWLK